MLERKTGVTLFEWLQLAGLRTCSFDKRDK